MKSLLFYFIAIVFLSPALRSEPEDLTREEKHALEKSKIEDRFWFAGKHTLKVVQNRQFKKENRFEFTLLNAGYFLKNQYIDIVSLGGAISYYFTEMWGWEIISGNYTFTSERAEVKDLRNYSRSLGTEITADIRKPEYLFTSNIVWVPMYGKYSLLESRFIYYDTYFLAGAGIVRLNKMTKPLFNIGCGQKYFMSQSWLTRVDLKMYFYEDTVYEQKGIRDKIVLSLGLSYVF